MALTEAMLARASDAMNSRAPIDMGAVALEYDRPVRLSLALEERLDAQGAALAQTAEAERTAKQDQEEQARADRIDFKADCVGAAVTDAIAVAIEGTGDAKRAERLDRRLTECLNDPREEDAFAALPISELIARICKGLGVAVDWSLWEDEDWAHEERREDVPGSPYAGSGSPPLLCAVEAGRSGCATLPLTPSQTPANPD